MFLRKLIKFGIFLIIFTPLVVFPFFIYQSNTSKVIYFRILTEIIFALWLILIIFDRNYRSKFYALFKKNKRWNLLLISVFLFSFVLIFSSIFGQDFYNSFWSSLMRMEGLFTYLHLPILFLILVTILKKDELLKLLKISVFISFIVSIIALIQKLNPHFFIKSNFFIESINQNRPESLLSNPDFLALYLVLFIFLALGLFFSQKNKIKNTPYLIHYTLYFYPIIAFVNLLALIFTLSRAGVLAFIAGIIFLGFIFIFSLKNLKKQIILFSLLILLLIVPVLTILNRDKIIPKLQNSSSINSLFQRFSYIDESVKGRWATWRVGFEGLKEKPLLGWGYNNFNLAYSKYFDSEIYQKFNLSAYNFNWFDKSHNYYLDLLVETGIVGFLGFFFILVAIFIYLYRLIKNSKSEILNSKQILNSKSQIPKSKFLIFIAAGLFAYFVNLLFLFENISSQIAIFLIFAFLCASYHSNVLKNIRMTSNLGKGMSLNENKINDNLKGSQFKIKIKNKKYTPRFTYYIKYFFGGILILLFLILVSVNFNILRAAYYTNQTWKGIVKNENLEKVLDNYNKALNSAPMYKLDIKKEIINNLSEFLVNKEAGLLKETESVYFNEIAKFSLNNFESDLKKYHPNNGQYYLLLGNLYILANKIIQNPDYLNKAEKILLEGIKFSPKNQFFYINLGMIYEEQGKYLESEKAFIQSIEVNKKSWQGYRYLGLLYIKIGKIKKSVNFLEKAVKLGYVPRLQSEIDYVAGVYYENKLFKALVGWYYNLVKNYPQNADFWVKLAVAMKEAKYPKEEIISVVSRAVELDPSLKQEAEMFIKSIKY